MPKYKIPSIQDLLDAGAHFGHQVRRWHPKMEPYIYSVNKNTHIIDLEKTEECLKKACEFLFEQAKLGKSIVFVGTKRQTKDIIENEAKRCGAKYVNERWVGGTITNFETIKKNLSKLLDMIKGKQEGKFDIYTKKERLWIDRDIEKLTIAYGGIVDLKDAPQVLFVIDPKREKTAIREAKISNVPVVSIVDTNANPTEVSYPIPANDDAIKSVALIVKAISEAIEEGYKEFGKAAEKLEKQREKEAKEAAEEAAKEVERIAKEAEKIAKEVAEKLEEEKAEKAKVAEDKPEEEKKVVKKKKVSKI
ncbi:MAG: 30S ribosomal protein S2 [Patescibacteria group bacterium]|nr:30S ribosomal protein S2 [Patescibacteria group bacterium]MBU1953293.1 30S ribosomal protein S2 [Patescibacteria group bacterium]